MCFVDALELRLFFLIPGNQHSQLPSGALFSSFFGEGFPFKVNQPKKDALFSHGHWAFGPLFSYVGRPNFPLSHMPAAQLLSSGPRQE